MGDFISAQQGIGFQDASTSSLLEKRLKRESVCSFVAEVYMYICMYVWIYLGEQRKKATEKNESGLKNANADIHVIASICWVYIYLLLSYVELCVCEMILGNFGNRIFSLVSSESIIESVERKLWSRKVLSFDKSFHLLVTVGMQKRGIKLMPLLLCFV